MGEVDVEAQALASVDHVGGVFIEGGGVQRAFDDDSFAGDLSCEGEQVGGILIATDEPACDLHGLAFGGFASAGEHGVEVDHVERPQGGGVAGCERFVDDGL